MSAYNTISESQYDKLGQLKKKTVGSKKVPLSETYITPRQSIEDLVYEYNIRGWLLGMNRDYLQTQGQSGTTKFAFELGYDNPTNKSGQSFTNPQYNGNISGMAWKSDGDDVRRVYNYGYDASNRFLKADFIQENPEDGLWNNSRMNYSVQMGDGSTASSAYDANGNIKAMKQFGWRLGGTASTPIDQLNYDYTIANVDISNKLKAVVDEQNIPSTTLGDFRTSTLHPQSGVKTVANIANITDYTYDYNGNLKKDLNKDIGTASADGIVYNHLNLPQSITIQATSTTVRGTIVFTYDASGNKLKKITTENSVIVPFNDVNYTTSVTTTTTYLNGFVYETKAYSNANLASLQYADRLQFLGQEEGRIRLKQGSTLTFQYDYMIKDHLGNVRMVLTEEQQQDVYPATTLENITYNGNTAIYYENKYYTIDQTKIVAQTIPAGIPAYYNNNGNPPYNTNNPYSNTAAASQSLYQLNATTNSPSNKFGLGIVLKVMAGDNINVFGKSYHKKPTGGYTVEPTNFILVSEIINAFASSPLVVSKGATASQITGQPGFPGSMNGLIGNQPSQTASMPKAAINWVVFDEQFKYVSGGFDMVGDAGTKTTGTFKNHDLSTIPTISIPKNGYIYVYCSNESKYNVFFDNLQVIHTRGPILEESHYYPFGLVMSGISDKALDFGNPKNNEKTFQGQRYDSDLDLDWVQFKWRNHDPQVGRFIEVDPLSEDYVYNSSYSFSENKVITHVELEGLEADWYDRQVERDLRDVTSGKINNEQLKQRIDYRNNNGSAIFQKILVPLAIAAAGGEVGQIARGVNTLRNIRNATEEGTPTVENTDTKRGRDANKLKPDKEAGGDHTTYKRDDDGNIYKYETWKKNEKNPTGFDSERRFDGGKRNGESGTSHYNDATKENIETPHIHEKKAPDGSNTPGGVRRPVPSELPQNKRFTNFGI